MKVLLVAPPKRRLAHYEEHPPVGLGYLATALRRVGHEPDIKDCVINNWNVKQLLHYVNITKPDVVGITVFSQALPYVKDIINGIKDKHSEIIIIVGGPHPNAIPEHALLYLDKADYGIVGEGEIPLQHLMEFLTTGNSKLEDIPGLIWRNDAKIRWNSKVEYDKLDEFGFPAWDLIDPSRYFSSRSIGNKTTVIHTSRGCPYECQFCVKLGKKLRYRSMDHIYQEIKFLNSEYGITRFFLEDEGFPINTNFTKAFCRYVIEKSDNFHFIAGVGLRLSLIDDELLELMKRANFGLNFGVGIESGVPRVRKLMKKNLSQEQIYRGIKLLNKHGFRPSGNFIIGYPGETKEEIKETIRVALRLPLWEAAFIPFIPLPGCETTEKLIEDGEIPKDFDFTKIDIDSVLYAPKGMSLKEVDAMRREAVFRFNIRPRILLYHLTGGRFFWTLIKAMRIFLPPRLVPRKWRRIA